MGWKTPGTTATAIDTGRGMADAGVRLFQDLSNPAVPQGVAQWRTGLMDRNAEIRLSGGGSGGSAFTLDGGSTLGYDAPSLELEVASAQLGGYEAAAWLTKVGTLGLPDDPGWSPFTCRPHSNAAPQPNDPNGTLIARYKAMGTRCDFRIWHKFGAGYTGSSGFLNYDLPFLSAATGDEQFILLRIYIASTGAQYAGWAYVPANQRFIFPYSPASATNFAMSAVPSSLTAGSVITMCGTYETATPST